MPPVGAQQTWKLLVLCILLVCVCGVCVWCVCVVCVWSVCGVCVLCVWPSSGAESDSAIWKLASLSHLSEGDIRGCEGCVRGGAGWGG